MRSKQSELERLTRSFKRDESILPEKSGDELLVNFGA